MASKIEESIAWIRSRSLSGSKLGLERVKGLLERIGNPQTNVCTIHIAGTNGKGSTVTYLRYLLEEVGLKVGTFISPYVISYNEQISINGQYISNEYIVKYVEKYHKIIVEMDEIPQIAGITEFEIITAMALELFFDKRVDVAIIEVGMGGLLDSTNVVHPILTAITTIGKDHTDFLGDTMEEIAFHKAGIIKQNIPVVIGNVEANAIGVIKNIARKNNCEIFCFGQEFKIEYLRPDEDWGEVFNFHGYLKKFNNIKVSLAGRHQCENAAVAIQLYVVFCELQGINLSAKAFYQGLDKAQWPARMEKISTEPLIMLDGAHNDHAVKRLAENMENMFPLRTKHILFSALSTKDIDGMIRMLKNVPRVKLYLTTFDYPKAVELTQLKQYEDENTLVVPIWQDCLEKLSTKMSNEDLLLVTGSLYFVSQVRKLKLSQN